MIMWMIKVFFFWQFNKITIVQKRITRDKNTQCTFLKLTKSIPILLENLLKNWKKNWLCSINYVKDKLIYTE